MWALTNRNVAFIKLKLLNAINTLIKCLNLKDEKLNIKLNR
jgi:hypothetical protein